MTRDIMNALKPCPDCGMKPMLGHDAWRGKDGSAGGRWWVAHRLCPGIGPGKQGPTFTGLPGETLSSVAFRWNLWVVEATC